MFVTVGQNELITHLPVPDNQTAKRLKSKPQDALEGVVLSVGGHRNIFVDLIAICESLFLNENNIFHLPAFPGGACA